ncbi:MAG: hypothetical protein FRX48_05437 [Lasallia pustulata]|uniref:Uncharacterized protein n=1 Tax=Lasallia pustulata TaxID=136370 RepID=A0A5M8PNS9_9LECA|nr:MAG: hypothetical protein FRX48_05437 [Lasallia pustulata]
MDEPLRMSSGSRPEFTPISASPMNTPRPERSCKGLCVDKPQETRETEWKDDEQDMIKRPAASIGRGSTSTPAPYADYLTRSNFHHAPTDRLSHSILESWNSACTLPLQLSK